MYIIKQYVRIDELMNLIETKLINLDYIKINEMYIRKRKKKST